MVPKRVISDTGSAAMPKPSPSSIRTGLMAVLGLAALASVILSSWPASTWMDIASNLPGFARSNGIHWRTCKDDPSFQCGMLSVPLNVRQSTTYFHVLPLQLMNDALVPDTAVSGQQQCTDRSARASQIPGYRQAE